MLDWLRNLSKSQEEKQRERLNAYLDEALSPGERQALEQELARNEPLRLELAELRALKAAVRQLPRVAVPRSFVLSPAQVGQKVRPASPTFYPALRLATMLTAFLFVTLLAFDALRLGGTGQSVAFDVSTAEEASVMSNASDEGAFEAYSTDGDSADGSGNDRSLTLEAPQVEEEMAPTEADEGSTVEEASAPAPSMTMAPVAQGTAPPANDALSESELVPTPSPTPTATAIPSPTPIPIATPVIQVAADDTVTDLPSGLTALRLAQIGLGFLFLVLLFATLHQRRKTI